MKRINIIEASMKHRQVVITLMSMLIFAGIVALLKMPRTEDPAITIRQGLVVAYYPGGNELEVEKRLTEKLEQYLFSYEEIKKEKTYSTTKEGQVFIQVELQPWVEDTDKFWATLQHGLNVFRYELPGGVFGPIVNSDFGETVALMLAISAEQGDYRELRGYLDQLEDAIKTIPEASKIRRFGEQSEQFTIRFNDKKLAQYGLSFQQVITSLKNQNDVLVTGDIDVTDKRLPVFTANHISAHQELADQIIFTSANGVQLRLKEVAEIVREYATETSFIKMGGHRVVMLSVEMQPGNNIVAFGEKLKGVIESVAKQFPAGVKVTPIADQSHVVYEKIKHFMGEFAIAIVAVIAIVILLLPLRMAVISAIASPISILITFAILNLIGIEIHQVTLVAMVIVLGMVVDDAIVIVDNYVEKLDEGFSKWEAAWKSATQLLIPVLTATIAIVFAFLPLAFTLKGLNHEFIVTLPATVGIALVSSFVVAIFLTPLLCYAFINVGLKQKQKKSKIIDAIQNRFNKIVEVAVAKPGRVILIAVLSIVSAMMIGSTLNEQFVPIAERDQFNIEVWMPEGTSLEETLAAVDSVEARLRDDKRIINVVSFVGTSSPRFHVTYAPEIPRENYAQLFINTISENATEEMVHEYLKVFDGYLTEGVVRIRQISFQESKAPLEVRIIGNNIDELRHIGRKVKSILQSAGGTNWVRDDFENDYIGLDININDQMAAAVGIDNQIISQSIYGALKGVPVTSLWEGKNKIPVVAELQKSEKRYIEDVKNIYISAPGGAMTPVSLVANVQPTFHYGNIMHKNGLRTLTIRSEAQLGIFASKILKSVRPEIEKLQLPAGMRIEFGGDDEASKEGMPNLMLALAIGALLIFITLLFQFKNYKKALIILAAFPLSLLGAMSGLFITGNPFGFTALLGLVSLVGITVRNGIILVDYADELVHHQNMSVQQAAIASAQRRMRPIFLTSSAAAVGVIPMIISKSQLWSPMASVLAVGIMFSMIMTLFVIPSLYYRFIK
jgi:multidrug efflux pump subunit AcrB